MLTEQLFFYLQGDLHLLIYLFLTCVSVLPAGMCVQCLQRPEEGVGPPELEL